MSNNFDTTVAAVEHAGRVLQQCCHGAIKSAGWWSSLSSGIDHIDQHNRPASAGPG